MIIGRRSVGPRWDRDRSQRTGPGPGMRDVVTPPSRVLGAVLAAILALGPGARVGHTAALPILTDGYTEDWTIAPLQTDPAGDGGASGVDFRNLFVAEDDDWLFIRFDTTVEIDMENAAIDLLIDADNDPGTGAGSGIGAELLWEFDTRKGTFYGNPPPKSFYWYDADVRLGPTTTGTEFEVAIARDAMPDGVTPLFGGNVIRVMLRDQLGAGDVIPDTGLASYTFTNEGLSFGPPNDFAKDDPGHVRIMTWNVLFDGPWDPARAPSFERILEAIDPDVINFQEIFSHSASQTRALVESMIPAGPGELWVAFDTNDCVTVSKFSFNGLWNIGANFAGLLDTSAELGRKLLVINAHLPCCDNDAGRQQEADQIMWFLRDAITPGGTLDVDPGTGIVITGDMNFVGDVRQLETLLTGDIVDEGTWGPDFPPDWDGTDLADHVSPQTEVRMPYTFFSPPDFPGDNPALPGRLDFTIYSDSVLGIGNSFIVFTPNMSPAELTTHGLQIDDSTIASDHLPHVTDLFDATSVAVAQPGQAPARVEIRITPNPMRTGAVFSANLDGARSLSAGIYDVSGRLVRRLVAPAIAGGVETTLRWDARTEDGSLASSGVYFVRIRGLDADGSRFDRTRSVSLTR